MTTQTFSKCQALSKLLNRVVVLLLGTPPTVVCLSRVVVFALNAATAANTQSRITLQGGCYGRA
ncbi:hypothetical protein [Vampirovibrio chlorellavorus]|uniref:hypothetical protein n=1 Tax=Vampirovibrio chlorellavorus TaxID=758823 RepID=UPI0026EB7D4D|nr:hypothetical protein [Vampirovibrio chlorellavorus]